MRDPDVMAFFTKLIQRVAPKSFVQAWAEVAVTQKFIENFSGDQVRFLARSFSGDLGLFDLHPCPTKLLVGRTQFLETTQAKFHLVIGGRMAQLL